MYHLDQMFPTKMISKFIVTISLICLSLAAQLPSTSYLPSKQNVGSTQNLGSLHSATSGNNRQTSGNTRAQQEVEKNAVIVQQVQEIEENGFHYAYETSNGIVAEESGNAVQTRGGFAYKGDDGRIYSITFNAGVDGFRPQGDHLPVPPPTPAEILLALKQNERDEAAGIFDDGQYHPNSNEKPRRPSKGSVANNQRNIGSHPGY